MAQPSMLAGYKLLERIGAGAETVIYRAEHAKTGEIVALKHLAVKDRESQKYVRHIRNEYKVLRAIQDSPDGQAPEGIVNVHKLIRRGLLPGRKQHILITDYVDGFDLRRENRFPLGQIVDILTQVAHALEALHRRGYIHGDLKPENIIVSHEGKATVIDFGFACKAGTEANSIRGTRDYMAPEQLSKGPLTVLTDIYNFGASMYFLLTGRHVPAMIPAQGDNAHFIAHAKISAPRPLSLRPGLPAALDTLVMHCLEKEPIMRPSSIQDVLKALSDVRASFLS